MLAEKILHYFHRYDTLRVLFLFDAWGEYRADFDELVLPDYRKLVYHNNDFELKVRLNGEWLNEKVVLYLPIAQPITPAQMHAFPLLDLLFANKSMQPDDNIGEFMEKYGLQRHQRSLAEKYLADLKFKNTQEVLKSALSAANFTEENVQHGLLAAFVKFTRPESWELIIMRLMQYSLPANDAEWKRLSKKINEYGLEEFLLNKILKHTGIQLQSLSAVHARELLDRIKYNLLVQSLAEPDRQDPYKIYWSKSISATASINMLHERLLNNGRYGSEWMDLLDSPSSGIHEKKIVELYGPAAPYYYYSNHLKWQILAELFHSPSLQPAAILEITDKLETAANTTLFEHVLAFIRYALKCISAINAIDSYILDKTADYIKRYTAEFYKIDQHYRKAILYCRFKIDFSDVPVELAWDEQVEKLNNHYRLFLEKLNREWLKCWSANQFDMQSLQAKPQYDFYTKEIQPLDQKVAVIISDALRYEAGLELMEDLNADAKNVAKSRFMVASVPSKTSVGMANLLPGKSYAFNQDAITIDGISADSTKRGIILKAAQPDSQVFKLSELLGKSQKENREIFKSKLVYIYHDVIDSTGDTPKSERRAFPAVEEAIDELTRFVKQLHATYNVARVIVTADHGFLYNDFTIEEKDKEKGSGLEPIIPHSRFEIVTNNQPPSLGYIFPLKATTKFTDDLYVVIPQSVNRYSRAGAGNQYVHGGASLQEMVVPVIESTRKREEVSSLVTPSLVTKDLKVVSNVLKFMLIQEEPVSAIHKERSVLAGLYRGSDLVSNEKVLELNKTGESPTERIFQVDLHLLQNTKLESLFRLKIFDSNDRLNALIEADVKNQTLIQTDF